MDLSGDWQSPYRIARDTWDALKKDLGLTERDTAPRPRGPVRPWTARGTKVEPTVELDPRHAGDPWYIALRRVGRLGRDVGEGRFAILCINDGQHSRPDGTVENCNGSTVLLPPIDGSRFGRPHCPHAHCQRLTLRDWIVGIGTDVYADALAEATGRRQAEGYLRTPQGIFEAKRAPLNLPEREVDKADQKVVEAQAAEDTALVGDDDGAPRNEPFRWAPGRRLANFWAIIRWNVSEHDPAGVKRTFDIEAGREGDEQRLRVPVADYPSLGWVTQLGSDCVIEPGRDTKDKLRAAIQHLSRPAKRRDTFLMTGWRDVGDRPVYLHGAGGLCATGAAESVEVRLDDPMLNRFRFEQPLVGEALREGVAACAALFMLAPDVTVPTFGATWRAALGESPLTVYLSGPPASGKTLLAALAQAHYGKTFTERTLPASLKYSTSAWMNAARAAIGAALFVVDDLLITGNAAEDSKTMEKIEAIARAQHNGATRRGLSRDGTMTGGAAAPRSLLMLTGEVLPRGHSLRTRLLVAEMHSRLAIDLSPHKALARSGVYAGTMAAFLVWLAPQLHEVQQGLTERAAKVIESLRGNIKGDDRTLLLLAEVAIGVALFCEFAADVGLAAETIADLKAETWRVLKASLATQQIHRGEEEPTQRFMRLVRTALQGHHAHLTVADGDAPRDPELWGWSIQHSTPVDRRSDDPPPPRYSPCGPRLGIIDNDHVWLFPEAALAAAQRLARETQDPLPITRGDLGKRLHQLGILARSDIKTGRHVYTHRKRVKFGRGMIEGLCISLDTLLGDVEPQEAPAVSLVTASPGDSNTDVSQ